MNGDISNNADVALAKAQAVAVASKNRQPQLPIAGGMPPQTSLANNSSSAHANQTLPMSSQVSTMSQPSTMSQQGMMPQPMVTNQAPPMQTHNIGKSPQNAGNISQSPHMSPQTGTPRQSPGPAIASKPVAATQPQLQNPQTPSAATPQNSQTTISQTPGAQTPPRVCKRWCFRVLTFYCRPVFYFRAYKNSTLRLYIQHA